MVQIIPAILATTPEDYQRDIEKLNNSQSFKEEGWVHIDFMDGKFVPNKSIGPEVLEQFSTHLNIEAHLMVEDPSSWVEPLLKLGVKRLIAHVEVGEVEFRDFASKVNSLRGNLDIYAGIALNPDTAHDTKVARHIPIIGSMLFMGVNPGFQGQSFIEGVLEKVKEMKASGWLGHVGVDGGMNKDTIKLAIEAGADYVVVGSAIMKGDIDENVEKIWEILEG